MTQDLPLDMSAKRAVFAGPTLRCRRSRPCPLNLISQPGSREVPSSLAASTARRRTAAAGTSTSPSGPTVPAAWTLSAAASAPSAPSAGPSPGCSGTACTEKCCMSSRSRSMTPPVARSTTSSIRTPAPDSIRCCPDPTSSRSPVGTRPERRPEPKIRTERRQGSLRPAGVQPPRRCRRAWPSRQASRPGRSPPR